MQQLKLRRVRALSVILVVLLVALFVAACGQDASDTGSDSSSKASKSDSSKTDDSTSTDNAGTVPAGGGATIDDAAVEKRADSYSKTPGAKLDANTKYVVQVTTSLGAFDIAIDQKAGPLAAANFVGLVKDGFYDGIKFHRIIKGFMVQTGDPTGTGMGGPGYSIKDDDVTGSYERGIVAMANAGPDTGGSQFFVVQGDAVQLGPDYAIFGKVDDAGMKTIDKIAAVKVGGDQNSTPTKPVRILSAKLTQGG